ncbi:hypothetical protein BC937DRAFT_87787, partial [Endogone sp. FLAS-F59071]
SKTILTTEEEEELVGYCLNMQQLGFGLTRAIVNQAVLEIVKDCQYPFSTKGPDETAFTLSSQLQKILTQKGVLQVSKLTAGNTTEHISICTTISAAGAYISPLIIFK